MGVNQKKNTLLSLAMVHFCAVPGCSTAVGAKRKVGAQEMYVINKLMLPRIVRVMLTEY